MESHNINQTTPRKEKEGKVKESKRKKAKKFCLKNMNSN